MAADDFWFAFVWWDRSVDHRGHSNSGFYVNGFAWPQYQEAFVFACNTFPQIVARQEHPLRLQTLEERGLKPKAST